MISIWYVHGAGASSRSFTWLEEQLPPHQAHMFDYSVGESLTQCIVRLTEDIAANPEPSIVIGHSLGGVIAAGVAGQANVEGVITLCAPLGGLSAATVMTIVAPHQMFRDITPFNPMLRTIRNGLVASGKRHLPIVATSGLPFTSLPNDGVVPLDSQMAIEGLDYQSFPVNHYEVLLTKEVVEIIIDFTHTPVSCMLIDG